MVDWIGSDQSKSAIFWHGEKDTNVLRDHWDIQEDNTIFPKCDLKVNELHSSTGRTTLSTTASTDVSSTESTEISTNKMKIP